MPGEFRLDSVRCFPHLRPLSWRWLSPPGAAPLELARLPCSGWFIALPLP